MRDFDIQGIAIDVAGSKAFTFIADPTRLPAWAHAFASVPNRRAPIPGRPPIDAAAR